MLLENYLQRLFLGPRSACIALVKLLHVIQAVFKHAKFVSFTFQQPTSDVLLPYFGKILGSCSHLHQVLPVHYCK